MSCAPVDALLARLERVNQAAPGQWRARCPAHESKGLTLSIGEADSGAALVHCFAGCGAADVLASVGLQLSDLYPPDELIEARRYDTRPRKDLRASLHRITRSSTVVEIAAEQINAGKALSLDDLRELRAACHTIREAAL